MTGQLFSKLKGQRNVLLRICRNSDIWRPTTKQGDQVIKYWRTRNRALPQLRLLPHSNPSEIQYVTLSQKQVVFLSMIQRLPSVPLYAHDFWKWNPIIVKFRALTHPKNTAFHFFNQISIQPCNHSFKILIYLPSFGRLFLESFNSSRKLFAYL